MLTRLAIVALITLPVCAQRARLSKPVTITVHSKKRLGPIKPAWRYFGYDEPNYTYAPNGKKLIGELARTSPEPIYVRVHNLLTTGDGTASLKWGSTNAYTEDSKGQPRYDWTIVDRIFDTLLASGARPFVEVGFMPEALSTHPKPYRHNFPHGAIDTGWAYPPVDYDKWRELVYQWVAHEVTRYGRTEVQSWYWEVWNEPDIFYWHGTPEEYDKLYDFAVAGVKRALPEARVGGPASTGPQNSKAAAFLLQFLAHCAAGKSSVPGQAGVPLDFITFHAKGKPSVVEGRVRMGLANNLQDVQAGFEIIRRYAAFRDLPIVLTESDPEGCAACSAQSHPENAYRNGSLYAAYTAAAYDAILELGRDQKANLEGMLTWAFEFEGQPYFGGFRTLATNGIDKPILNLFRMDGLLEGESVAVSSTGALSLGQLIKNGAHGEASDVNARAARSKRGVSVMVWNYHDDEAEAGSTAVALSIEELKLSEAADSPPLEAPVLVHHYRIDEEHSNAFTAWRRMGSPQQPTPEQQKRLEGAGMLQLITSPEWVPAKAGKVELHFELPRAAVSLVRIEW